MASANKWRVKFDSVGDPSRNFCVAAEIQFFNGRETAGLVATQTGSSASVAAGSEGFGAAWQAFDNNVGTIWHDSGDFAGADFISWDFGTSTTVTGFAYRARSGSLSNNDSIKTGGLEYFNGSTWVRLFSIPTQSGWLDNELRAFFDPASDTPDTDGYRYWEVIGTAGGSGFNGISQLLMARATGGNIIPSNFPTVSTGPNLQAGSGYSVVDTSTLGLAQWNGNANTTDTYLKIDFGSGNAKKIRQITVSPNKDAVLRTWTAMTIVAYNNADRSDATTLGTWTPTTWVALTPQTLTLADYGSSGPAPTAAVGSASGTSTAIGIANTGTVRGTATGTGTATGVSRAIGTIGAIGQATAIGVATGVADPIRRTTGSATGTGLATGVGAAVGTIGAVGSASGTGTAGSGSAATGILSTRGSATSTGVAAAFGSGRLPAVGSAAGTSTAGAVGSYVPSATVGRAAGTSTVNAGITTIVTFIGDARGTGDARGQLAGVRASIGAATGVGSSNAITNATRTMVGAAAATSNVLGVSAPLKPAVGSAAGTGVATGAGSYVPSATVGRAAGTGNALGVSQNILFSVGAANATSGAAAVAIAIASAVGAANSTGTSTGVSRAFRPGVGQATGTSVGDGRASVYAIFQGSATGRGLALGTSVTLSPGLTAADIVVVAADTGLVQAPTPDSGLVVVAVDDPIVVVPVSNSVALAA